MKQNKISITELANTFGVSPSTVSRAVNDLPGVSEELRAKIKEYARKTGYHSRLAGRGKAPESTNVVAVIIGDVRNVFYSELVFSIQRVLREHGYLLAVYYSEYNEEQEAYYNAITTFNCPTFCIPQNTTDVSMSAVVMQALACRGETSITPVYYNTILKEQATRDSDSWRMLDIIFENRIFDLCTVYNFGNLAGNGGNSYISVLVKNGQRDQLISTIEIYASTANKRIEELMTFYDENYVPQS